MHAPSNILRRARGGRLVRDATAVLRQCRPIQISAAPTTESPRTGDAFGASGEATGSDADARFEVLGSPYSLLSVTLSASQQLYTRRGTLVAVAGKPENAQSTLSLLSPLTRALVGIPFLYQRISSTTPVTALIATKSPTTSFSVLHLDGTTDWMVSQRNALLAWTGHTLSATPRLRTSLGLAYWGSTLLTGRGLAALSAPGQVYQLTLADGEEFVAHPGSVVAYSVARGGAPQPFRFKSSTLRLQVPSIARWFPENTFLKNMRDTDTYRFLARALYGLRTSLRRTIWGDRLFLQFRGPATLLLSSRGVRVAEALTAEQVNEVADAPAGVAAQMVDMRLNPPAELNPKRVDQAPSAIHVADVRGDGKVTFEDAKDLKQFLK